MTNIRAVGSFDEAFASRIHISIHYGDLGEEGRQVIWENLFKDLESDRPEVFIEYSARAYVTEDGALRSLEWNGRQIRNGWLSLAVRTDPLISWLTSIESFPDCCFIS